MSLKFLLLHLVLDYSVDASLAPQYTIVFSGSTRYGSLCCIVVSWDGAPLFKSGSLGVSSYISLPFRYDTRRLGDAFMWNNGSCNSQ